MPRRWLAYTVLLLPVLFVGMDVSILYFAIPDITGALHPSSTEQLWILDMYGFVLAGLLLTMGAVGDRIGRRRLLLIGAAGFGAASVAAAYATTPTMLIAARAALGIGGATLMPSTMALVRNLFDDREERRKALAIFTGVLSGGTAFGPIISGLLLQHFWWGSVFLVNVPAIVLLLVLAPRLLPESRDPQPGPFDFAGAALSLVTILPLVYALKHAGVEGLDAQALAAAALGLAAGTAFVGRLKRTPDPLIDVTLFRNRTFTTANLVNALGIFAIAASGLFSTQYLQLVRDMQPLTAALWSIPPTLMVGVAAGVAAALAKKVPIAHLIAGALIIAAAGFAGLTGVEVDTPLIVLLVASGMLAGGVVAAMTVCADVILTAAPPERAGAASAISETSSELGGALGIAILGTIGAGVARHHATQGADQAFVSGYHAAALTAAAALLIAAAAAIRMLREPVPAPAAAATARP